MMKISSLQKNLVSFKHPSKLWILKEPLDTKKMALVLPEKKKQALVAVFVIVFLILWLMSGSKAILSSKGSSGKTC